MTRNPSYSPCSRQMQKPSNVLTLRHAARATATGIGARAAHGAPGAVSMRRDFSGSRADGAYRPPVSNSVNKADLEPTSIGKAEGRDFERDIPEGRFEGDVGSGIVIVVGVGGTCGEE